MLGKRETNSFQNTLYIQSQRQRIYGQIIYIKLCKNPLDRLFEKGNGGGAKGRKEGRKIEEMGVSSRGMYMCNIAV